ncbi:transposase IS204/IS1001/IS1096/IS1165 family protein [Streptomyces griseus]|nr:hypothetical protein SAMN04490359_2393 [Streptomyces griseus]SQA27337.1 transposase IS204/IS1001/IS1096/IS1165 family protein [Streptomyces griseus]
MGWARYWGRSSSPASAVTWTTSAPGAACRGRRPRSGPTGFRSHQRQHAPTTPLPPPESQSNSRSNIPAHPCPRISYAGRRSGASALSRWPTGTPSPGRCGSRTPLCAPVSGRSSASRSPSPRTRSPAPHPAAVPLCWGGAHVVEARYRVTLLARNRAGWARLCRIVSAAHAARGFPSSEATVRLYVSSQREALDTGLPQPAPARSVFEVSRLLMTRPERPDEGRLAILKQLLDRCPELDTLYDRVHSFAAVFAKRRTDLLDRWTTRVKAVGIAQLISYANGLLDDFDAVRAGVALPHSSGVAEGRGHGPESDQTPDGGQGRHPVATQARHPRRKLPPHPAASCRRRPLVDHRLRKSCMSPEPHPSVKHKNHRCQPAATPPGRPLGTALPETADPRRPRTDPRHQPRSPRQRLRRPPAPARPLRSSRASPQTDDPCRLVS